MIDLVAYYAKRNDKALEDGDKRLAVRYARLEEAERIARSGKLSDGFRRTRDGEIRREMAFEDTFSEPDGAVPSVCDMR